MNPTNPFETQYESVPHNERPIYPSDDECIRVRNDDRPYVARLLGLEGEASLQVAERLAAEEQAVVLSTKGYIFGEEAVLPRYMPLAIFQYGVSRFQRYPKDLAEILNVRGRDNPTIGFSREEWYPACGFLIRLGQGVGQIQPDSIEDPLYVESRLVTDSRLGIYSPFDFQRKEIEAASPLYLLELRLRMLKDLQTGVTASKARIHSHGNRSESQSNYLRFAAHEATHQIVSAVSIATRTMDMHSQDVLDLTDVLIASLGFPTGDDIDSSVGIDLSRQDLTYEIDNYTFRNRSFTHLAPIDMGSDRKGISDEWFALKDQILVKLHEAGLISKLRNRK